MVEMIERMNLSADEFIRLKYPIFNSKYPNFIDKVTSAYINKDVRTLKNILKENKNYSTKENDLEFISQATVVSIIKNLDDSFPVEQK